ncbi:MAG: glutathione S-transferase family protein [Parvibaculales bacterium]
MSVDLELYGPTVSTFTRICAMAAAEAGLSWKIIPTGSGSQEMAEHHPFMRSPAAYIDGLHFYESPAICSYIDRAHNAAALHPEGPEAQARMWQWANVAAHYVFPITEERLVMPRVVAPLMGRQADEQMIAEALPVIRYHLQIVDARLMETAFLAGAAVSLADLFMYPVIEATCAAPEGREMVAGFAALQSWFETMGKRPSVAATAWPDPQDMLDG